MPAKPSKYKTYALPTPLRTTRGRHRRMVVACSTEERHANHAGLDLPLPGQTEIRHWGRRP
jgi:hypothetical protein